MMRVLLALGLLLTTTPLAWAARTIEVGKPLHVRLAVGQMTVLVLPELLSSATPALPDTRMMIGEDGQYVMFVLLDPTVPPGRVAVVGVSGTLYLVHYTVAEKGDDEVHLIRKAATPAQPVGIASLMRSVRQGTVLPGMVPAEIPVPTITDPRISLSQPRGLRGGTALLLSVLVQNQSDTPVTLDERVGELDHSASETVALASWVWPPQLTVKAVWLAETVLQPQGQTTLAVIFEEVRP